jgi:NADP-dependent aldehyde dehydrogenase
MREIWINGEWRTAQTSQSFRAFDPETGQALPQEFPIGGWQDCDQALAAAAEAAAVLREVGSESIARFLEAYATRIDAAADELCAAANRETGLPIAPRLKEVELKRTTNQLRQAAAAARDGSWSLPTIDTANKLRSYFAPIGPVVVIGPNNFPLAFNAIAGGDFAAAIAAGNPVIAKGHPSHPETTYQLARIAYEALLQSELPPATCQLLYHVPPEVGLRMVADPRVGAVGFTGSRASGLALKAACDAVGKPIYLEMSSLNPVVILPGALRERGDEIADQLFASCTAAAGQMCTSPGLVFLVAGAEADRFAQRVAEKFRAATPGTLLSSGVQRTLGENVERVRSAGAELLSGGRPLAGPRLAFENTLFRIGGSQFAERAEALQTEMFGTASLVVAAQDGGELIGLLKLLHGNLTGAIYSSTGSGDDSLYEQAAAVIRPKVGRLMNDKMPTGVVVSPAMQHGGPYPASGHPGFTSVGIPASLRRFAMLQCFDHVREQRLPPALRDQNPNGQMLRWIDGRVTTENA